MIFAPSLFKAVELSLGGRQDSQQLINIASGIADSTLAIWQYLAKTGAATALATAQQNHFGETTKDIDIFAKQAIAQYVPSSVVLATEEDIAQTYTPEGRYTLFADPLDGSGHVNYHSSCGTFFSVLDLPLPGNPVLSGYALYGYQLILVLAAGSSLIISAYNPESRQFYILHNAYTMPSSGAFYSLCDSDTLNFSASIRTFIDDLRRKGYKSRYNGVLVADLHRIIMQGGIFLSPTLESGKTKTKKYFEAIAITHIMKAAHGLSVHSYKTQQGVLSADNSELFSTVPIIFGSKREINKYIKTGAN